MTWRSTLPALLLTVLAGSLLPVGLAAAADDDSDSAAARLDAVAQEFWDHLLEESVGLRLQQGLPITRLPDFSYEHEAEAARWSQEMLGRLRAIDPAGLDRAGDHERWLSWKILAWQLQQAIDGLPYFWYQFQVTPYTWSFSGVNQVFAQVPLATAEDRARYVDLLGQVPGVAGTLRSHLETQRQKGILLPRPEIDLVLASFRPLAALSNDPTQHPYAVADERLEGVAPDAAKAFQAQVASLLDERVAPAFQKLLATFDDAYRAAAPEAVGLGQYPGGADAYRFLIRFQTGLDLTPEEIHQRGLQEVERIDGEMAEVRHLLGFEGTARELNQELRTDPRFLACSPAGVAERLTRPLRRIEPVIGKWFHTRPEAPYGVARLDPGLEAGMTFGYYQEPTPDHPSGTYLFNGSSLDQRPLVNAAALIYHELIPGHHFQISLQEENGDLPSFRRNAFPTAFVEGWAEYASALAGEMGMYREPYDRYGRLSMDMFLSTRLVVDTGMNALGWSRERALDFMRAHLLESDAQLATETLRYSVDIPGQALAYKIGSATIRDLREHARAELGDRFDVRRFHDAVLGHGAMPLAVLTEHVDWWIAREKARPAGEAPAP